MAKVARLTNVGKEIGPGSYDPKPIDNRKSPTNMAIDKSTRAEHFLINNNNETHVGPQAYNIKQEVDRSIKNPTIARG